MKQFSYIGLLLALFALCGANPAWAASAELEDRVKALEEKLLQESRDFRVYWDNGLNFDSRDKKFKYRIGGRMQYDWAFLDADAALESRFGPQNSGAEARRARLFISGLLYNRVLFKAQYDFAGASPAFKDVFMGLIGVPVVGNMLIGHFQEPFSLEELTSNKYLTFMERSLLFETFNPDRNLGIAFYNQELNHRLFWAAGVFRDTGETPPVTRGGDYALTGRVAGLPWYEEKGRKLLHLGISYSHRKPAAGTIQFRARPEVHLAGSRFVDTGVLLSGDVDQANGEAAVVFGPFSLQGEYSRALLTTPAAPDADLDGFYAHASWFLTGEHRPYKGGSFARLFPRKNFLEGRGIGAWQIAARYSQVDLDDPVAGVRGGFLETLTFGVNWYLNPHTKMMFNYVNADPAAAGELNAYQVRFQVDF